MTPKKGFETMLMLSKLIVLFAAASMASVPAAAQDQYEGKFWPERVDITRYIHVYDGNDTVRLGEMTVMLYFEVEPDYIYPTVQITASDIDIDWVGAKSVADYQRDFPGREPNFTDTSQASAESSIRSRAERTIDAIRGEVLGQLLETIDSGAQRIRFDAFDRSCEVTLYISEGGNLGGALGENRVEEC
ncbi:MAG: hypothetical protein AAFQ13_08020 [Pseudomonadota bacterium]